MNTRFDPKDAATRHPNPIGSPPVVETATEARQGRPGRPVLTVLVCGLVLAVIAWGGAEWWGASTAPPAEQTATPPAGSITPGGAAPAAPTKDPVMPQQPTTNPKPSGNP